MEGNRKRVTGARKYCRKGDMELLEWKLKEINRTMETERGKQKEGNRKKGIAGGKHMEEADGNRQPGGRKQKGENRRKEIELGKRKEGNTRIEIGEGSAVQ